MNKKLANLLRASSNSVFQIPYAIRVFSFILSVTLTTAGIGYYVVRAANTTIGNNISTSGTLTVGSTSLFSGNIAASSTLQVAGTTTLYGIISSTSSGTSTFAGGIRLSGGCFQDSSGSCITGGGGGGSGTVNSGTQGQIAFYETSSTEISGTSTIFLSTTTLNVGIGTTTPGAKLSVAGTSLFDGLATFYRAIFGNISATGTLSVTGLSTFGNASSTQISSSNFAYFATTGGAVGIGTTSPFQKLSVHGNALISGDLSLANLTATGTASISGNTSVGGTLSVTGVTTLSNASTTGMITIGNGFISSASSTVTGAFNAGDTTITGTQSVSGLATLSGGFIAASSSVAEISATRATTTNATSTTLYVSGTLSSGTSTVTNLIVTNTSTSTIAGGLAVQTDKLVVDKNTGNVGIGSTTPGAKLSVSGTSLFDGLATMYQALVGSFTATGTSNLAVANLSGLATFSNGFISTSSSTVSSFFNVSGPLNASSTLLVGGNSRLYGTLTVDGATILSSTLNVTGVTTLSNASTTGMITIGNGFISSASSTVTGAFNAGDTTITGTQSVSGLATLSGGFIAASSSVAEISATRATTTNATSTTLYVSGTLSSGTVTTANLLATGSTTLQDFTANNATTSQATTTYLAVSGTASTSRIIVSNNSFFGGLSNFLNGFISSASSTFTSILNVTGLANFSSLSTFSSGFISSASSTVSNSLSIAGQLNASSTLLVANLSNLYGGFISSASSTIAGPLQVAGNIQASSSLSVANLSSLYGGFISSASSTIANNLTVSGQINSSSTITVTSGAGTSTIGALTIGQNNWAFGTTTPNIAGFEVATRTIAFNSGADASVGPWASTTSRINQRINNTNVMANGRIYVMGGADPNTNINWVEYSKINSDGSLGAWATSTPLPITQGHGSSVYVNGYIYFIGGNDSSAVYYAKVNSNGTLGPWTTNNNSLPYALYNPGIVVANGYMYSVGGGPTAGGATSTVYFAKLSSDGSVGAFASTTALPAARIWNDVVTANGYIYSISGTPDDITPSTTVYYARINSDGTLGNWSTTSALNTALILYSNNSFVSNGYVYVVGGANSGGVAQTNVQYAKLNNDGTLGSWINGRSLPMPMVGGSLTANGYVYSLGQKTTASTAISNDVIYASLSRTQISGNLDLIGLASTTISDWGGDTGSAGSSIFAGNIFSQNRLEVGGNTSLWGGLGVNGILSLTASSTAAQNHSIFTIQNATNTRALFTVQYDGKVGIGTSSPVSRLDVRGGLSGLTGHTARFQDSNSTLGASMVLAYTSGGSGAKNKVFFTDIDGFHLATSSDDFTAYTYGFTYANSGNFGINDITPDALLEISADNGSKDLLMLSSNDSGEGDRLIVKNSGNVGVNAANPYSRLQVTGAGTGAGQLFGLVNSGSTTVMQVLDNGNVGIGTTSPYRLLSVDGGNAVISRNTAGASRDTDPALRIINPSTATHSFSWFELLGNNGGTSAALYVDGLGTGSFIAGNEAGAVLTTETNHPLIFGTNGGEKMRISSGGNVGIGTTTPNNLLDIYSTNKSAIGFSGASGDAYKWTIGMDVTNGGRFSIASSTALGTTDRLVINGDGRVGIATTSPSQLLSVHGNALFSGNLSLANIIATGTISVTSSSGTSTIGALTIGQNNWAFGTTTPTAGFEVATRTIALGSDQDAGPGRWASTTSMTVPRYQFTSFVSNGFLYTTGGYDGVGTFHDALMYSKINSDGTIGAWATSSYALPNPAARMSAVTANGYVYVTGSTAALLYSKLNSDGNNGPWKTALSHMVAAGNVMPQSEGSGGWMGMAATKGYIYFVGGYTGGLGTTTVTYAKLNSDGSTGPLASTSAMIGSRNYGIGAVIANGFIYVLDHGDGTVQYSRINPADGTLGPWTYTTTNSVTGGVAVNNNQFVHNGYLYSVGYRMSWAKINRDGSLGAWQTDGVNIPDEEVSSGQANTAYANGYVYRFGGLSVFAHRSVMYTSLARTKIFGNLDLIGFSSSTISDQGGENGSVGGSLYAGSLFAQNRLEVGGNTSLWGGLNVVGGFSLTASTSALQTASIFSIQNATSTNPLFSLAYNGALGVGTTSPISGSVFMNGNFGIGTSTPGVFFAVQGNGLFSGNLSAANVTATGTLNVSGLTNLGYASSTQITTTGQTYLATTGGNVGIGTTSPSAKLSLTGSGTGTGRNFVIADSNNAEKITILDNGFIGIGTTSPQSEFVLAASTAGTRNIFRLNDYTHAPTFTVTDSGFVGIGEFPSLSSAYVLGVTANGSAGGGVRITNSSAGYTFYAEDVASDSTPFVITNGGDVGVGTSSPYAQFAITSITSGSRPMFQLASSGNVPYMTVLDTGNVGIGTTTPSGKFSLTGSGTGTGRNFVIADSNNAEKIVILDNGTIGLGTTTPGANFAVQGNSLFSGNISAANMTATGTISVTSSSGTSTIGALTIGQGNYAFGTTTPNIAGFEVATRTLAFNSGADGNIGSWKTANSIPAARNGHGNVVANGYMYVTGGYLGGVIQSSVYYAKVNSDGSLGTWQTNPNNLAVPKYDHSSVVANGFVYTIGGLSDNGNAVNYAKINNDGTLGVFATNTNSLPSARAGHSSVVANGFVYVIGGATPVWYAKLNSDGSTGPWIVNNNALPAAVTEGSAFVANGYVYYAGGYVADYVNTVYYAKLNADGSIGSWNTTTVLPAARYYPSTVVANGYAYVLGGYDGTVRGTTYYGKLNSDGTISSWATSNYNLPVPQYDHTSVAANGYVYVVGGSSVSTVYYSSLPRVSISGNLDLIGLASTTLGDINNGGSDGGSVGGSIFAGSIFSAGKLEVIGGSQIWGGLGLNGTFSLTASTSALQTASIFSIQNATGTSPILNIQYDGKVGIGTSSPTASLEVVGSDGNTTAAFDGTTGTVVIRLKRSGTEYGALYNTSTSNNLVLRATDSSGALLFQTGGSNERLRITPGGAVGIGTTTPGGFLALSVATITPALLVNQTSTGDLFNLQDSGTTAFLVRDGGNVGIGTSTPSRLLSVHGNALFSGNLSLAKITATGTISAPIVTLSPNTNLHGLTGFNSSLNLDGNMSLRGTTFGKISSYSNTTVNLTNIGSVQAGQAHFTSGGTFATNVDYATGDYPYDVAVGDLNGDGRLDIVTAQYTAQTISVLLQSTTTAGTFNTKIDYPAGTTLSGIAVRDLNGDGKNDVIAQAYGGSTFRVFMNQATSTQFGLSSFASFVSYDTSISGSYKFASGDLNGDGFPDIAIGGSAVVGVFMNNGEGKFGALNSYATAAGAQNGVGMGDFNGDGKNDLVSTSATAGLASVLLNNGDGTFATAVTYATAEASATYAAVGDLNGDGYDDFFTGGSGAVSVFINQGDGTFATKVDYPRGLSYDGDVGDITGDGKNDLIANNASVGVSIFINNGNGVFGSEIVLTTAAAGPIGNALGDMNGDGRIDIVESVTDDVVSVLLNNSKTLLLAEANSGRIGIGTSTPRWALQVASTSPFFALSNTGAGTDLKHWTMSSQGGNFYIATSSDAYATSSIPAFMISSVGNVGIGTSSPQSKLSIEGTCIDTGLGCADYAELYDSTEEVVPGDILSLDSNVSRSVRKARTTDPITQLPITNYHLVGAVSSNPAMVIEGSSIQLMSGAGYVSNPTKPAVALAGRIPVKVNLEGGEIKIGDPITISSEPGIGKKATESGRIIGYALEDYAGSTEENNGKVLVFASLEYWNDSTQSDVNGQLSNVDSLLAQAVNVLKDWLESMQVFIENGLVRLQDLVARKVTVEQLCVGQTCVTEAQLQQLLQNNNLESSAPLNDSQNESSDEQTEEQSPTATDTTAPIITLTGSSSITITKGDSWVDPGASVTDPADDTHMENNNLSIYYKVNGTDTGNEGRDLPQSAIDTNVSGTYTITYTATDSAGNIGTAERTLIVEDPAPAPTPTPEPEPEPTPTPEPTPEPTPTE